MASLQPSMASPDTKNKSKLLRLAFKALQSGLPCILHYFLPSLLSSHMILLYPHHFQIIVLLILFMLTKKSLIMSLHCCLWSSNSSLVRRIIPHTFVSTIALFLVCLPLNIKHLAFLVNTRNAASVIWYYSFPVK